METEFFEVAEGVYCLRSLRKLSSNVYFLEDREKVLLVDCGVEELYPELQRALAGRLVERILVTHGHFDHVEGARFFPNKVFLHEEDGDNLATLNSFLPSFNPPQVLDLPMEKTRFGSFIVRPVHVPGHTPGSTVFFEEKNKVLFSGDSLFARGVLGRTDLPLGSLEDYGESLKKIYSLKYEMLCPGHGELE